MPASQQFAAADRTNPFTLMAVQQRLSGLDNAIFNQYFILFPGGHIRG